MRAGIQKGWRKWATLASSIGLLALLTSFQWASSPQAEEVSDALLASASAPVGELLPVIDAHTHTDFTGKIEELSGIMHSKEEYLREMREAGVVGAVSHTTQTGVGYDESLRRDHNVTFCGGVGAKVDVARIEAGLRSGRYGCIKIYLGYVHQWAYDPNYEAAYKLAEKYDVPVVFHTGDTSTKDAKVKYADPLTIDEVAVDHPKVTFVIAHCGNPWIQSAAEVTYKNDNVYMECSALTVGTLKNMTPESAEETIVKPIRWIYGFVENPKKLMFGTDFPLLPMKGYLEAYKRAIPREHWREVFHDNAVRVFKMRGAAGG